MIKRCYAELCRNWTGFGCVCIVLDMGPDVIKEAEDA